MEKAAMTTILYNARLFSTTPIRKELAYDAL